MLILKCYETSKRNCQGSLNVLREGVLTKKINVGVISSSMAFKAMEMDEIT